MNVKSKALALLLCAALLPGTGIPAFAEAAPSQGAAWAEDAAAWAERMELSAIPAERRGAVTLSQLNEMAAPYASGAALSGDAPLTRLEAVGALYALLGGTAEAPHPFADVDASDEALSWAWASGMVNGVSGGSFAPSLPCSWEMLVTMLYRWAKNSCVEKSLNVYRASMDEQESVPVRFYNDMPNVPYIEFSVFYNAFQLSGTEGHAPLREEHSGDVWTLTAYDDSSATVDTAADTVYMPNRLEFVTLAYTKDINSQEEAIDPNYPFLRFASEATPEEPVPQTLSFGDYGIDLRGGEDGLWIPVAAASNLFNSSECFHVLYNGKALYVEDFIDEIYEGSAKEADSAYYELIRNPRRQADVADFSYRLLCFNIDNSYGFPGGAAANDVIKAKGLDRALAEDYPAVRALLRSRDFSEYESGLGALLLGLLDDGGHTAFTDMENIEELMFTIDEESGGLVASPATEALQQYDLTLFPKFYRGLLAGAQVEALQAEVYPEGEDYVSEGDIAYIRFSAFDVDIPGWKAHYAEGAPVPGGTDAVGIIWRGLERAKQDPAIRKIVIDLGNNGGGNTAALLAIEEMLAGDNYILDYEMLSGQDMRQMSDVDLNFDGSFDEGERGPVHDFQIAVLTSAMSFSCANAFPAFMKENGYMIIGERSGGGACAIEMTSTADGLQYSMSSGMLMHDRAGNSVDEGIPVDLDLVTEAEDEDGYPVSSYEEFYNFERVSAAMDAFYSGQTEDAA